MNNAIMMLVDDDEVLRSTLARAFQSRGFEVIIASNHGEVLVLLKSQSPDFAVVDLKMPGESGMTVLKSILEHSPDTKSIVLTGYGSIANAVEAMRLGAVNYVTKPADADQILSALDAQPSGETESEDIQSQSLAQSEWNHIQKVLSDCDGNITHAAKILDIPRRTLQRKLKKRAP